MLLSSITFGWQDSKHDYGMLFMYALYIDIFNLLRPSDAYLRQ